MKRFWFTKAAIALVTVAIGSAPAGKAEYPVEKAYLKASNAEADDVFGDAVAISGNTIVVGATFEGGDALSTAEEPNDDLPESGAVYVYVWNGSEWEQQAYLKASNPGELDLFGGSVAISGDTIVVGAPTESGDASATQASPNDNADAAGAAYVFERTGTTWTQTAYLKASNLGERDLFGVSVAISGDIIAVGASNEAGNSASTAASPNDLSDGAGAVYVFERDGADWMQTAYLKASNAGLDDRFGESVAICGDHLISGAWTEDGNHLSTSAAPNDLAPFAGAAYIFERNPADQTWSETAYLKASNAEADDEFGLVVAISGDVAVVGAVFEGGDETSTAATPNNALDSSGAAYIFERDGANWNQTGYLKAGVPGANHNFATAVAIEGGTIVVGAGGEDQMPYEFNATGEGAAYVFQRFGNDWKQSAWLKASNADGNEFNGNGDLSVAGDGFGLHIGISGTNILVASPGESGNARSTAARPNNRATDAGAAYVYGLQAPRISSITHSASGLQLEIPLPCSARIEVEYTPDPSIAPWVGIGDFVDAESDGIGTYTDTDPVRKARAAGFYRGVLR